MALFEKRLSRKARLYGAALLFFALMAFICLHPQLFQHRTHGAGYDYFFPHWTFWWTQHALTTADVSVFESDYVMFPHTSNYAYNALTLFWYPLWAALESLVGTLSAITIIIALACTLNGYLLFVWLLDEKIAPGLALIGGVALQIFPISRYFYYNTHINLMNWFWIPVHLWLWKRIAAAAETARFTWMIGLAMVQGIALWGVVLTGLQPPIFVAFVLGPYGALTVWRAHSRRQAMTLFCAGLLAIIVAIALLWGAGPLPHIVRFDEPLIPSPVTERPVITPTRLITMADTWWEWDTPSFGAFVTLGTLITVIVALLKPARRNNGTWFWFLVLSVPFILALGPTLTLGSVEIPLPFRLLYQLTQGNFRMPWRLAPVFVITAAIFTGKVWSPMMLTLPRKYTLMLAGLFLVLAVDLRLYETGPLRPVLPAYSTYATMGEERGAPYDSYVVLEVPTGAGTGEVLLGDPAAIAFQYYGITHGKRMVNGFISRAPLENFWYLHIDDPLLSWLGQRRLLEAETVRAQLRERIDAWPIGYIVVHQDYVRRNRSQPLEIIGYFNGLDDLLCAPVVEGEAVFYRTTWHPDGCPDRTPPEAEPGVYTVDVGTGGDERYLGWGWHWQENVAGLTLRWAGDQPQAQVYIDLPPGSYDITFTMQAFEHPRQVAVLVNGVALGAEFIVSETGLAAYIVALPAALVGTGKHTIVTLVYDDWLVPAETGTSQDQRRLAVAVDGIQFRRRSE